MPRPRILFLLGAAAAVVAAVATFRVCKKTEPFYFEISVTSSDVGGAELYYDLGRGINAADSVVTRLREGKSVVRLPLQAGEYRSIRYDPVDHGYCRLSLKHAQIKRISGTIERRISPQEFTAFHDMSRREIVGDRLEAFPAGAESDPGMTVMFAPPLKLYSTVSDYRWLALKTFSIWFASIVAVIAIWFFFRDRGGHWQLLCLVPLACLTWLGAYARFYAPVNFDEGAFIWYGWLVNHGAVPYRDIFEPKGPMIFVANALGLSLFGFPNFLFRIVPTAASVASIILLYVGLVRTRIVPWLAAMIAGQVALWLLGGDFHDTGLNDTETYGLAFAVLGLSFGCIGSSLERGWTRWTLQFATGICFGLSVLTKELFVLTVVPAWVFLGLRREGKGLDWAGLMISAAGVAIMGFSFLGYLLTHSAWGAYMEELRFSRKFAATYCIDIGCFPRVSGLEVVWQSFKMLQAQLYNLAHLRFVIVLSGLVLVSRWASKQRIGFARLGVVVVAILFGMISVSIGHCFWRHYFLMGITGLLLLMMLAGDALSRYLRTASRGANLFIGAVALAGFVFAAWAPVPALARESYSRRVANWDSLVTEIVEQHSAPGDYVLAPGVPTILVALNRKNPYPLGGPSDAVLPFLADLPSDLQLEALRAQLEQNLPKVCYFPEWFRPHQDRWHELLYDPLLRKYNYVKVNETLWYLPDTHQ